MLQPADPNARAGLHRPNKYFHYDIVHPSDRAHEIVGERLFAEVVAIPEPIPLYLIASGLVGLMLRRRQRRA